MTQHDKYQALAEQLAKAIDIANEAIQKFPPKGWTKQHVDLFIAQSEKSKDSVLNPKPVYKNLKSLKEEEYNTLTPFQEGGGKDVEYFWSRIREEGLPFQRENKMLKILKRKKINNPGEYDFVVDTIVPYQQEGFITEEDVTLLNEMINVYEQKHKY